MGKPKKAKKNLALQNTCCSWREITKMTTHVTTHLVRLIFFAETLYYKDCQSFCINCGIKHSILIFEPPVCLSARGHLVVREKISHSDKFALSGVRIVVYRKLCRDGTVVRALVSLQCDAGLISRLNVMWVEFVGSLHCTKRSFSGYSGFPLSSKTNI